MVACRWAILAGKFFYCFVEVVLVIFVTLSWYVSLRLSQSTYLCV